MSLRFAMLTTRVVAVLTLILTPRVLGQISNGKLAATSWSEGRLDVFYFRNTSASNTSVLHQSYNPSRGWQDTFDNLGAPWTNNIRGLEVLSIAEDSLDVFVNSDGLIWHRYWNDTASKWEPASSPAAVSIASDRIDVVAQSTSGEYAHFYQDFYPEENSDWLGWTTPWTGELFQEGRPALVATGRDGFDLFGVALNGSVLHLTFNGTQYSGWRMLDTGAPTLGFVGRLTASSSGNRSWSLWAVNTEGRLWQITSEHPKWEIVAEAGLALAAAPEVAHRSANRTDLVAAVLESDSDGYQYWHLCHDGHEWHEWKQIGSDFASEPTLTAFGAEQMAVFGITMDGEPMVRTYDNSCESWTSLQEED